MRRTALLLIPALLSLAFAPAPLPKPGSSKDDLDKLQGNWDCVLFEAYAGKPQQPAAPQLVVAGGRMTFKAGGHAVLEWDVTLTAEAAPKSLDVRHPTRASPPLPLPPFSRPPFRRPGPEAPVIRAVYALRGDTFEICHNNGQGERPASLASKVGHHGRMVFKRSKR